MIASHQVDSVLLQMKEKQRNAADEERHLRAAQIYVRRTLRKALEGFDIYSIDLEADGVSCRIQIWLQTKDSSLEKIMDAIEPDREKWRPGPAGFSRRITFQFCQGALKGMIAVGIYWVLYPGHKDAAMPQKQENL